MLSMLLPIPLFNELSLLIVNQLSFLAMLVNHLQMLSYSTCCPPSDNIPNAKRIYNATPTLPKSIAIVLEPAACLGSGFFVVVVFLTAACGFCLAA